LAAIRVTAARDGCARQSVPLEAGRAVADEADRVDGLAGASRRDHDAPAGEVAEPPARGAQDLTADLEDLRRIGQPAAASVGAREPARGRVDHDRAPLPERRHVGAGGRVLPHLGVHRRREDHGTAGCQEGAGEQVSREPVRGLGEQIGGGGRDDDQIGPLPDADVRHLVHVVPHLAGHPVAREGRPGGLPDEAQRLTRGHDAYVMARLGEQAEQLTRLVGGDAPAHPEDHPRP
jgi:hypothetical protein